MAIPYYGAKRARGKAHLAVDLPFWMNTLKPAAGERIHSTWVDSPRRLVQMALRRKNLAVSRSKGVPADLFLWAHSRGADPRYLTQLGGRPWRESSKPWPRSKSGAPLCFIAQLCFLDSLDLFDNRLPGDVLLIFASACESSVDLREPIHLEWSKRDLKRPLDEFAQLTDVQLLPFALAGVRHRIEQYPEPPDEPDESGVFDRVWQGTIIGRHAFLPQGNDEPSLIATLSSLIPDHNWPLLNVPVSPTYIAPAGHSVPIRSWPCLSIGDAGVIAIRAPRKGQPEAWCECG